MVARGQGVETQHALPSNLAHLICKLRWIGLDEEAKRLELALGTLPPERRGGVSFEPLSTD